MWRKQKHKLPFQAVWGATNGYAWQSEDFREASHDLARRSAQWNMLHVGITICGLSSWQFPCILNRFWNKESG